MLIKLQSALNHQPRKVRVKVVSWYRLLRKTWFTEWSANALRLLPRQCVRELLQMRSIAATN